MIHEGSPTAASIAFSEQSATGVVVVVASVEDDFSDVPELLQAARPSMIVAVAIIRENFIT